MSQWRRSGVFSLNSEQISNIVLMFPLLTLNKQMPSMIRKCKNLKFALLFPLLTLNKWMPAGIQKRKNLKFATNFEKLKIGVLTTDLLLLNRWSNHCAWFLYNRTAQSFQKFDTKSWRGWKKFWKSVFQKN